jgi:uncharacterized membrane protein YqjE
MSGAADIGEAACNLSESLARLKQTSLAMGRGVLDSLSSSLQEEERRVVAMVAGACAAVLLLVLALCFGGVAIIMAFRDSHPVIAAAAVAAGFALLAGAALWFTWRQHRRPTAFARAASLITGLFTEYRRASR